VPIRRFWRFVVLQVNDRFQCSAPNVDRGKSVTVEAVRCVADDGARFLPLTMAPLTVRVTATVAKKGERLSKSSSRSNVECVSADGKSVF